MRRISPILRSNLLAAARAYAKARGNALSTVSQLAHGDGSFFDKIAKRKASFTVRKYDEVMQWFEDHWPQHARMPTPRDPQHGEDGASKT